MIQAGGFFINYKRVTSPNQALSENDILPNDITLVRVGKLILYYSFLFNEHKQLFYIRR